MSILQKVNHLQLILFLSVIVAIAVIAIVWFGYFYHPYTKESGCEEIPSGSVVLVSGFDYRLDEKKNIVPGEGNLFLAQKLAECADQLSIIITQEAVVEAMIEQGRLFGQRLNGAVPVYLMHQHRSDVKVRTLQSLQCAVGRLSPQPDTLVILAHDKHLERATQDLRSVFDGEIIEWRVNDAPYFDENPLNPLFWAGRELFVARPAETFLRWVKDIKFLEWGDCPKKVEFEEKIDWHNLNQ